jgi:hypothetical protein
VVNVTSLGETNDGVDENICLSGTSSANGELTMGAVDGIPRLKSDDPRPSKLVKV